MTPEERAKATWRECFDGRRSTKSAVDIIAQAIRSAENDKLEEAAAATAGACLRALDAGYDRAQVAIAAAVAVRSLKTPKD